MEELQLILNALSALGEAGKEAFIWWLVMDKGLTAVLFCVFFWVCYAFLQSLLRAHEDTKLVQELCEIMYGQTPYPITSKMRQQIREQFQAHRGR